MPVQYDVAVIGGGPAGLATAIEAARLGFRTVVLDGRHPPIDKACGEGLMPDAIQRLARFGITIAPGERGPFRGIEFSDESSRVAADFPSGDASGVKRTTLQRLLAQRAKETGVEFLWDTPVTGVDGQDVICRNFKIQAHWVIGADGMHSHVKRWLSLDRYLWNRERVAFRQRFEIRPFSEYVQVIWGEAGQCYITPVGPSEISVAVITHRRNVGFRDLLRSFPSLTDRLPASAATSPVLGSLTASRRLRRVSAGHVALVGDASGSVDAITGEGICLALQQAEALGSAMEAGDLSTYGRKHAAIMRRPALMAATLAVMSRNHGLRSRVIRALSEDSQLFERMLAFHLGASGLRSLGLFASLRLGSGLLRPVT
jgi:menaquinone-9 beta-reductase